MVSGRIPRPSYGRVYEEGRSVANKYLVMYYREDPLPVRLGIVASKRLGKACVRNRVKRRITECFRHVLPLIEPRGEFVFIARQRAALCSYQELLGAATDLLKRMDLLE
ncbi:MAG: ribonuclease P protein component [Firmicutes bacterium]|nr:ribonuclease P protein component [Candidatus Fermentithermobacillaceae bacterium]